MGCRTMRPNWSSRNLTLVPAAIPCLRRSSAGTTSWPFEVNVALASFMTYILSQVRHPIVGAAREHHSFFKGWDSTVLTAWDFSLTLELTDSLEQQRWSSSPTLFAKSAKGMGHPAL